MRRLLIPLIIALGLTGSAVATTAVADAATTGTYTVSRTFGPYNGQANWTNDLPGQPPDGEARVVECANPVANGDTILSGRARINHRTTYGTTGRDVITLDVIGAFWNSEVDHLQYGAFVNTNGRKGWNSVTLTIVCRRH